MTTSATAALMSKNGQRIKNPPQVTKVSSRAEVENDRSISRDQHLLSPPPIRNANDRRDTANRKVVGSHASIHKRNMSMDVRGLPSESLPPVNHIIRANRPQLPTSSSSSSSQITLSISQSAKDASDPTRLSSALKGNPQFGPSTGALSLTSLPSHHARTQSLSVSTESQGSYIPIRGNGRGSVVTLQRNDGRRDLRSLKSPPPMGVELDISDKEPSPSLPPPVLPTPLDDSPLTISSHSSLSSSSLPLSPSRPSSGGSPSLSPPTSSTSPTPPHSPASLSVPSLLSFDSPSQSEETKTDSASEVTLSSPPSVLSSPSPSPLPPSILSSFLGRIHPNSKRPMSLGTTLVLTPSHGMSAITLDHYKEEVRKRYGWKEDVESE